MNIRIGVRSPWSQHGRKHWVSLNCLWNQKNPSLNDVSPQCRKYQCSIHLSGSIQETPLTDVDAIHHGQNSVYHLQKSKRNYIITGWHKCQEMHLEKREQLTSLLVSLLHSLKTEQRPFSIPRKKRILNHKYCCQALSANSVFLQAVSSQTFITQERFYSTSTWLQFQKTSDKMAMPRESVALLHCKLFHAVGVNKFGHLLELFLLTSRSQQRKYAMKRKNYKFPELKPEDLEEMFVRGSGPGGQSVNKTSNCVVLKHKPSGIVVRCHESRSLDDNRKGARMKLEEKLDLELKGDQSYISQLKAEASEDRNEKRRRAKKKLAMKKAFKEREGLE